MAEESCVVDTACPSPVRTRGACNAHYKRALRTGDMSVLAPKKPPAGSAHRSAPVIDGFKRCFGCGEDKPIEEFHGNGDNTRASCRTCEKHYKMARVYGLSREQYDAMYAEQDGHCAICGCPEAEAGGRGFHVDHDHDSGVVRGLLCTRCNIGIGQFGDDPDRLIAASLYLVRNFQPKGDD